MVRGSLMPDNSYLQVRKVTKTFGDFRAKTVGVGPAVSYIRKLNNSEFLAELKWLHETNTQNRLQGDTVFLKAMLKY